MAARAGRTQQMSLTQELVALCERPEPEIEGDSRFTPITAEALAALTGKLMLELGDRDLRVFAYGSLIWKPTFEHVEVRSGILHGWHRSFCLEMVSWRGTPQQPGLMMALDRGGQCKGAVYRLAHEERDTSIGDLLEREIGSIEDLVMVRWGQVEIPAGTVRSLVFWAGPTGLGVSRKLPLQDVAYVLARACGYVGSNAGYLYNTVAKLEEFGIRDRNLWTLQRLVADEIRSLHGKGVEIPGQSGCSTAVETCPPGCQSSR